MMERFGLPDDAQARLRILADNPLGLLLVGLAIGTIVGVVAPVSKLEREKIAPLRDEVVDRAKRAADDVVEHGRGVVEETISAASASTAKHGQALAKDIQREFRGPTPS
ncbi:MAG: hypothetical protein IAI49_02570 [Candidatus Eremiobacteraeota bacterium]|nr:hypothetical protein [Candidatus Eremiobacteraeota bacterium]